MRSELTQAAREEKQTNKKNYENSADFSKCFISIVARASCLCQMCSSELCLKFWQHV